MAKFYGLTPEKKLPATAKTDLAGDIQNPATTTGAALKNTVNKGLGVRLNLVTDGDSITAGVGSTMGRNWPTQLLEGMDRRHKLSNVAVPGDTVQLVLDRAAATDAKFEASRFNVATLLAGTNSFMVNGGALTAQNIYDQIVSWHQGRRAAGFKTVAMTILPRNTADQPANTEERRLAINTLIRTNWASFSDAVVDFENYPLIGAADAAQLPYYPDKLHPNNAGYKILSGAVADALATLGVVGSHEHPQYLVSPLQSTVTGIENTALGDFASWSLSSGARNTHIGYRAGAIVGSETTTAVDQVVVGAQSGQGDATASSGITAVGGNARAKGTNATAIGRASRAYANHSIAIGAAARADHIGAVAIGVDTDGSASASTKNNEFRLGTPKHHVVVPGNLQIPTAAPATPVDGNIWLGADGLYFRLGGVTVGPLTAATP